MDPDEKRHKWREWSKARRERMTPEERAEESAKKYAAKVARYSTPEGREKRREMDRRWRAANPDRVRKSREAYNEKRRQKAAAARAQEDAASLAKAQRDHAECYARRKARLNADPEAKAAFQARQRKYWREKAASSIADPEERAAYLAGLESRRLRRNEPRPELTEQEKEDRARRRREAIAKAQRVRQAQLRAERERREAEDAERRAQPARPQSRPQARRMGRFAALSKWHGY